MLKHFLILITAVTVCSGVASAQQNVSIPDKHVHLSTAADNLTLIEKTLAVIRAVYDGKSDEEREANARNIQENLAAQQEMARWAGDVAIAAIISSGLTLIGLIVLIFTLVYKKRAAENAKSMVEPARTTADAAIQAAEIAQQGNIHAQKMGYLQTRAYLSVKDVNVERFGSPEYIRLNFTLMNTGLSPAYNVRALYMAFVDGSRSLGEWTKAERPNYKQFPLASSIVPRGEYGCGLSVHIKSGVDGDLAEQPSKRIQDVEIVIIYQTEFQAGKNDYSSELTLSIEIPKKMSGHSSKTCVIAEHSPLTQFRSQWMDGAVRDIRDRDHQNVWKQFEFFE